MLIRPWSNRMRQKPVVMQMGDCSFQYGASPLYVMIMLKLTGVPMPWDVTDLVACLLPFCIVLLQPFTIGKVYAQPVRVRECYSSVHAEYSVQVGVTILWNCLGFLVKKALRVISYHKFCQCLAMARSLCVDSWWFARLVLKTVPYSIMSYASLGSLSCTM